MRRASHTLALAGLGLALASAAPAGAVSAGGHGSSGIELEDLAQTGASSFDDFTGRAVLIEFFAYW